MKTAYALRINERNLEGIRYYGYAANIPDDLALDCYLVLGSRGPYTVIAEYFEEAFEFTGDGATIDLTNLLDFGADKDERTLRKFVPKNPDENFWNSFIMQLFSDNYNKYKAMLHSELKVDPRDLSV